MEVAQVLVVRTLVVWVVVEMEWMCLDGAEGAVEGAVCVTEPVMQVAD